MRWITYKNPEIGETRSVSKFAWLPVKCRRYAAGERYYTVWLECYEQFQIYVNYDYGNDVLRPTWKPIDNDPNWIY